MTVSASNKINHGILNASQLEILHYVTFLTRPFDQLLICVVALPFFIARSQNVWLALAVAGTGFSLVLRLSIPDFVLEKNREGKPRMISHLIPCHRDVTGRFGSSMFSSVVSYCGNTASCSSFSNSRTDIHVENEYSMVSLSVDVTWWWH